jgi:excisionase family DNA binding protein
VSSRASSVTVLVASNADARSNAAHLAAEVDLSSEFGARVRDVLEELAQGNQVVVVRSDREVTPAGAAELLGVTRQFVDRLLADGTLSFRRLPASAHRRIRLADALALAEERDRRRQGAQAIRSALEPPAEPA